MSAEPSRRPDLVLVQGPESDDQLGDEVRRAALNVGRRVREQAAARAPAAGEAWWEEVGLSELVNVDVAAAQLGVTADDVLAAVSIDEMLAVEGQVPRFQVLGDTARTRPTVSAILGHLRPVTAGNRTVLAWFLAPRAELDGHAPAAWLISDHDPERLVLVAAQDAARLRA